MDRADASPPVERPGRRLSALTLGIALLATAGAAAGFIVTGVIGAGVSQAGRWVVGLKTTLADGATISGTGVVLTASGEVVTTYGVVDGAVSIAAQVNGGSRYAASTFALDPDADVAVLQLLNAAHLPRASVGSSTNLGLGDDVTAIGVASTSSGTMDSEGAITELGARTDAALPGTSDAPNLAGLIQFNAPLPPNGTGGPLVDGSGDVVGLDAGTAGGAAVAIPVERVLSIVREVDSHTPDPEILQGHGAYLGIEVQDSTAPPGARITEVAPGTPAGIVGIAPSDVIVSIDRVAVRSARGLTSLLAHYRGGDRVVVGWLDPSGRLRSATTQLAAATFE
jgi:serine protease Do